jgi:dynactin complex subunit
LIEYLEVSSLVDFEVEVSQSEREEKVVRAKMDINEIISNVHDFVEGIKESWVVEHRMAVGVDNFNFSIGESEDKYNLKLNLSCSFSPNEIV